MRGYLDGETDRGISHDSTWSPSGYSSDYEQGWNDGYNGKALEGSMLAASESWTNAIIALWDVVILPIQMAVNRVQMWRGRRG